MTRQVRLRLKGHAAPDGELSALEGVALIEAFRDLIYRITRDAADKPGLGRTEAVLERLSAVRFGLSPGSTVITFEVGDDRALDVADSISTSADQNLWTLVTEMSHNQRADTVSDSIASQMSVFVRELKKISTDAEFTAPGRPPISIQTRTLNRDIWAPPDEPTGVEKTVHGLLEMVDLHSAKFRIRDAAHNTIELREVTDAAAAARLVGTRVTARGRFVDRGATPKMSAVRVTPCEVPGIIGDGDPGLDEALVGLPVREPEPVDLTPKELDDFLKSIHA